jgi:hypothetical protein
VQAANTFHLSSDARLLARGIRQLGTQEIPNGLTYGHAPTIGHSSILPDFTLTWVATHWDYYWQTGDLSLFRSMRDRVHRALAFFEDAARGTGLLPYDDRYWLFLDWVDIFKDGYPTLYNMLYLLALRCASDLFGLCRDHAAARRCARLAARLKREIAARLFRPRRGIILGGLDWKRRPVDQDSPHTYAMAVLLDLFPEHHAGFAARVLLPFVAGDGSHPVRPSPFFTYYVLEALKKLGYDAEVVDCVRRWWGDMVDRGLGTCEEVWNAQPGEWSLCHAWSAHPIVHLANAVLGIRQTAPAWREILFRPALFSAGSARGSVPTPNGPVSSEWGPVRDGVRVRLRLPKGVSARVELPGVRAPRVRGGATWTL